ncbi:MULTISPECIES: SsgA family sporulation/cell division regulator [unclassified Streptomyces]|uniref:SsgA family sporulation/cell division regulator n=1 Tax=unclassified Streptomyces TaxID=2593676 RepID=UPI0013ACEC34|nr:MULTISPECIES: SsgA family sporulation/cell division regulator [unclassified Streptomyces]MYS44349.1 SsgA family sporulation/cell division regulator [Streptomyces sp. SID5998]MYX43412.1 SsgA family sporulation/cell division regulator [Streptomyces sp. SID89]NED73291.1 SsgA family sporulation/cell division regulator [Streptomyces sp. SID9944]NED32271.1 SsgA family sporulation/cell division regulator [Streptomyces sp. SID8499]NMO33316.1 SsgA family sporulation/cell division regulator [Streptom
MDITFAQTVSARLITLDERDLVVSATLRYAAADPLAVHVDFPPEASVDGDEVSWTFARSLLEEGLARPAGTGDVHLWPCGEARTVLELHAPSGMALLQFATPALRRFLLRTHAVVAPGREDVGAAVERGLDALFGTV